MWSHREHLLKVARRRSMSLEDAATTLGVASEQLVKDLRVLIYCGWPGWMPGDLIEVDLDALLASLGAEPEPAAEGETEVDLDALLASL